MWGQLTNCRLNMDCHWYLLLWQLKVKVVTKVKVEDVEVAIVDKEQLIKAKSVR